MHRFIGLSFIGLCASGIFFLNLSFPTKALAVSVHICNKMPFEIQVVIGYKNEHGWQAKGWYTALPGECLSPNIGTFQNQIFYYYAESDIGTWYDPDGPTFCISKKAFHYKDGPNCKYTERFRKINAGGSNVNYTINFTCSDCTTDVGNTGTFGGKPRLKVYGKWCGPGHPTGNHPGAPIDRLDQVCHDHDRAYHRCNRTTNGAARTKCEADADLRMVADLATLAGSGKLNPKQIAYASVMASSMVAAAKTRYTWATARNIEAEGKRYMQRAERDVKRIVQHSEQILEQHISNALNDLLNGPGPNNEICKHTSLC